jgi:hypothetical protein
MNDVRLEFTVSGYKVFVNNEEKPLSSLGASDIAAILLIVLSPIKMFTGDFKRCAESITT